MVLLELSHHRVYLKPYYFISIFVLPTQYPAHNTFKWDSRLRHENRMSGLFLPSHGWRWLIRGYKLSRLTLMFMLLSMLHLHGYTGQGTLDVPGCRKHPHNRMWRPTSYETMSLVDNAQRQVFFFFLNWISDTWQHYNSL